MDKDGDFVNSLARGFRILTCFTASEEELGNGVIARRSGLAPATVARLTHTLTELGYLRSVPLRRTYALTPKVLAIAHPLLAALPERALLRPHIHQLTAESGGSVCVAVADRLNVVYVEVSRGINAEQLPDIGTQRHLFECSSGRALFASSKAAARDALLHQMCLAEPERSEHLRDSARSAVEQYERYGMCHMVSLLVPEWSGVAMPLTGFHGRQIAISIGMRTKSILPADLISQVGSQLATTVSHIKDSIHAAALRADHVI
ncbi:helix-turn-helix domain-containing protein [Variovorax ureilyticus]|uniref:Helix-turn-helix domain-containing protein n=1 Tax=Variovorax ureilyticus TaxID=1836198 RepID=A0ABU8VLW3_9BURK